MNPLTTKDGTQIFYKDWGAGRPVVFSHGWPLSADAWDAQMLFLGQRGYRVVAHDRRGHGRSGQTWGGNDMDTYADDLAQLFEALDLKDATLVGHSTGGGEVARYIGRHGTSRLSSAVLLGAVTPLMLRTDANPGGLPLVRLRRHPKGHPRRPLAVLPGPDPAVLRLQPGGGEGLPGRAGLLLAPGDAWRGIKAGLRLHPAVLGDGLHGGLQEVRRADAGAHGDDDQIVPIGASALMSSKLVQRRDAEDLPRGAARAGDHTPGRVQRRPARLHPGLSAGPGRFREAHPRGWASRPGAGAAPVYAGEVLLPCCPSRVKALPLPHRSRVGHIEGVWAMGTEVGRPGTKAERDGWRTMRQKHTPGQLRPPPWTARARPFRAFRAQTFAHVDAVHADALCLTGRRADAADLVVEAYVRAFRGYDDFRRHTASGGPKRWETLAWLYNNLHAAFCEKFLARAASCGTPTGG